MFLSPLSAVVPAPVAIVPAVVDVFTLSMVVEQLVLENLREVVSYVKAYEDEFVQMVMDADIKQKSKELAKKKRVLSDKEKRYTQLDGLFQRIYEDNVSGKLSDERFVKLSQGYEAEQKDLQSEIEALRMELSQEKQQGQKRNVHIHSNGGRVFCDNRNCAVDIRSAGNRSLYNEP